MAQVLLRLPSDLHARLSVQSPAVEVWSSLETRYSHTAAGPICQATEMTAVPQLLCMNKPSHWLVGCLSDPKSGL